MFAKLAILYGVVAVVLSAPPPPPEPVPILAQNQEVNPDGSFHWNFESGDGTSQDQSGQLKEVPPEEPAEAVQGSASWTDPEGGSHQLSYEADENGYRPQSADLPVGPETPSHVLRALEYIAAHPQPEEPTK